MIMYSVELTDDDIVDLYCLRQGGDWGPEEKDAVREHVLDSPKEQRWIEKVNEIFNETCQGIQDTYIGAMDRTMTALEMKGTVLTYDEDMLVPIRVNMLRTNPDDPSSDVPCITLEDLNLILDGLKKIMEHTS